VKVRGSAKEISLDDARFYKPLAELGIEFKPEDEKKEKENGSGAFHSLKKAFNKNGKRDKKPKPARAGGENLALKEVLDKTLKAAPVTASGGTPLQAVAPEVIPLNSLKDKIKDVQKQSIPSKPARADRGRAASAEEMNKLKDLITAVGGTPQEAVVDKKISMPEEITTPARNASSTAEAGGPVKVTPPPKGGEGIPKKPAKEVPEDVLRKILE
jgi:hypothetical protein